MSFRVNLLKHWEALGGTFLESPKPPFGARVVTKFNAPAFGRLP
jgi:hypothetical protein